MAFKYATNVNSRLVTKDEVATFYECEACDTRALKHGPLRPVGWHSCGRSRKRVVEGQRSGTTAHWCAIHACLINDYENPRDSEIERIRQELIRQRQEQSNTKWSARREGLVPCRS